MRTCFPWQWWRRVVENWLERVRVTLIIASLGAGKVGDEAAGTTRACGKGEPLCDPHV